MVDTHAHLFKNDYSCDELKEVLKKMSNNIIIVSGTNYFDNLEVLELVKKYPNIYGTLGVHPTEENVDLEKCFELIEDNISNEKIIGIGEIGLDYHYDVDKDYQKDLFIKQIELANKYNKVMVIHSRDCINETYEILKKYKNKSVKFVMHCFSSSCEMAHKFIEMNGMLGIGGVVTYKNSRILKDVVEKIDLKYLLLETDSPYLTPVPFRGTKNEPYNIIYVAEEIAKIKNITVDEVKSVTTANAYSQFDLVL